MSEFPSRRGSQLACAAAGPAHARLRAQPGRGDRLWPPARGHGARARTRCHADRAVRGGYVGHPVTRGRPHPAAGGRGERSRPRRRAPELESHPPRAAGHRDFLRRSGSLATDGDARPTTTQRSSSGRSSPLRRSPPLSSSLRGSPGASAWSTSRSTGAISGRREDRSRLAPKRPPRPRCSVAASAPRGRQRHRHARRVRMPHRVGRHGRAVVLVGFSWRPAPRAARDDRR